MASSSHSFEEFIIGLFCTLNAQNAEITLMTPSRDS